MTGLRPVTEEWPSSAALWDSTSLPLGVVVTPLHGLSGNDQEHYTAHTQSSLPLSCVPKCLHCGAPHPMDHQGNSHNHTLVRNTLLCFLCGKASSTRYHDQATARFEEDLPREDYQEAVNPMNKTHLLTGNVTAPPATQEFRLPLYQNMASLPAHVCPPVFWIAVDGSSGKPNYWNTVGTVLQRITRKIPSYVHVGLLVASSDSLVIWDLSSPVPHARHVAWPLPSFESQSTLTLPLSPASSFHLPAALRALADTSMQDTTSRSGGMPLGATLEAILETMQKHTHPGNHARLHGGGRTLDTAVNGSASATGTDHTSPHIPSYAGGRVLCLLSGPPVEVGRRPQHEVLMRMADNSDGELSTTSHGTGGFGGSCAVPGRRYLPNSVHVNHVVDAVGEDHEGGDEDDPELGTRRREHQRNGTHRATSSHNNDDMTPSNLQSHFPRTTIEHVEAYFHDLGCGYAEAAIGVDVLILSSDHEEKHDIGVPLLRGLSDRSGAPAPLLFSLDNPESLELFEREALSRTPWHRPHGFGSLLRLRLSRGFHVDRTPVDPLPEDKGPQLAPLYASGGCMGPATALDEDGLWMMGACDDTTTLTVDLKVGNAITHDIAHLDGYGDVALPSAMQICVAFTAVEPSSDGQWIAVRKMRVTSIAMPLAKDTEALYSTLDLEVLAVILYHKLSIASLDDGLVGTQEIAVSWLESLLVNAHRSAEREELRQLANAEHGLTESNQQFFAQERLLDRPGGELLPEEVLLGQGHERLRHIPRIIFALMQCDALRPSSGSYHPSFDARCAAFAQMYSMSPSVLTRCIAPRLELWERVSGEPVLEDVDLCLETVKFVVGEHCRDDTVLFLDSSREILVICSDLVLSPPKKGTRNRLRIGDGLKQGIEVAMRRHRVLPPVVYKLDSDDGRRYSARLLDSFIEDSLTVDDSSFRQWKMDVASLVKEQIAHP